MPKTTKRDKKEEEIVKSITDRLLNDDRDRGVNLSEGDFTFDDGAGNVTHEQASKTRRVTLRVTDFQHRLFKEWCVSQQKGQSEAFLEGFTLLRNKHGA
jgi:hypothetical protein